MKMSAREIFSEYNKDRSRENMQRIADMNGCTLHEVGEFLKNAATPEKKKPGRPKKLSSEPTKKDEESNTSNIIEPLPEEKRAQKYLIPEEVEIITREKIAEHKRMAEMFQQKAAEAILKANELQDFLNGGCVYGHEDAIHGQV